MQAGRRGAGKDSIRPTPFPGYYTLSVCQLRGREAVAGPGRLSLRLPCQHR